MTASVKVDRETLLPVMLFSNFGPFHATFQIQIFISALKTKSICKGNFSWRRNHSVTGGKARLNKEFDD